MRNRCPLRYAVGWQRFCTPTQDKNIKEKIEDILCRCLLSFPWNRPMKRARDLWLLIQASWKRWGHQRISPLILSGHCSSLEHQTFSFGVVDNEENM